jgi:hypothetical protein
MLAEELLENRRENRWFSRWRSSMRFDRPEIPAHRDGPRTEKRGTYWISTNQYLSVSRPRRPEKINI